MRTSYFDIDFTSQMKLTKFPLIHCFEYMLYHPRVKEKPDCAEPESFVLKVVYYLSVRLPELRKGRQIYIDAQCI